MPEFLTQLEGEDNNDESNDEDEDYEDDDDDGGDEEDEAEGTVDATLKEQLLLLNATKGFNNLSRYGMLSTVRHRGQKISRFTFNCYCYDITLICK